MGYEGSMKGSGIYAEDKTIEVDCPECGKSWEEDFVTDDWGDIEADVKCECGTEFTFTLSSTDYNDSHEPDRLEDMD